jgi:hypothetical protein
MFAWLMTQKYIRESQGLGVDIRKALEDEQNARVDDDLVPFGIISNGLEEDMSLEGNDLWVKVKDMYKNDVDVKSNEYIRRGSSLK